MILVRLSPRSRRLDIVDMRGPAGCIYRSKMAAQEAGRPAGQRTGEAPPAIWLTAKGLKICQETPVEEV